MILIARKFSNDHNSWRAKFQNSGKLFPLEACARELKAGKFHGVRLTLACARINRVWKILFNSSNSS
jgi:hypothetical protein